MYQGGSVFRQPDILSESEFKLFRELIYDECGFSFGPEKQTLLESRLRRRMDELGIANASEYYNLLKNPTGKSQELPALLDILMICETSFFRNMPQFQLLKDTVLPEIIAKKEKSGGRVIRVWSAGCSTGQEAYSLAMCAIEDNPNGLFTVWGSDISHQAIKIARQARFGPRAVTTIPEHYRQRYLVPSTVNGVQDFTIANDLRQRVRFMTTNLVEPDSFRASHDVVFCHNVLIYFSPAAVTQAVARLAASVGLGGYLLLGPGEAPHDRPPGLEPVIVNGLRAFQRRTARPTEVKP